MLFSPYAWTKSREADKWQSFSKGILEKKDDTKCDFVLWTLEHYAGIKDVVGELFLEN